MAQNGVPKEKKTGTKSPVTEWVLMRLILCRAVISLSMVLAGIGFLAVGSFLIAAPSGDSASGAILSWGQLHLSARGLGAVLLVTSVLWGFFAFLTRPTLNVGPVSQRPGRLRRALGLSIDRIDPIGLSETGTETGMVNGQQKQKNTAAKKDTVGMRTLPAAA